jgi:ribonuclease HIII
MAKLLKIINQRISDYTASSFVTLQPDEYYNDLDSKITELEELKTIIEEEII